MFGGGEKYEDASLADAMGGAVLSKTDTYRIASPEVVAVKGGFALLKDGRTVQILAADRLYRYWAEFEGGTSIFSSRNGPTLIPISVSRAMN